MSKTQDKKAIRLREHADFLWQRDQLLAASAQKVLDEAILKFETNKDELDEETIKATEGQIEFQKEGIKQFLLHARDKYVERLNGQEPTVDEDFLAK